jgi:hypothetical protein
MKRIRSRRVVFLTALTVVALLGGAASAVLGICGPFTDVSDASFCPFVLEIFYLNITTGTTPTTYGPTDNVTRLQMAAFLSRTVDRTLQRGGRRASLEQFWTPQNDVVLKLTTIGNNSHFVKSDGADLWVPETVGGDVSRIRGSDGKLLQTWTGAIGGYGVLVAVGDVFVTGDLNPGLLYRIDPSQAAGAVTTVATNLGPLPFAAAFDGSRIWTTNNGSVSIVTPGTSVPWTVTTVTTGFSRLFGAVYDGTNVWVTDNTAGTLLKLNPSGSILQTVTVGPVPSFASFDGTNIWVPNFAGGSISVVRASSGVVLATLTGNGMVAPSAAAFDGQRVLVTNNNQGVVSLWKAADLTPLGSVSTGVGTQPFGACSDGINFWIVLNGTDRLARF